MIVSPSVSLVAAGVASGICFVLIATIFRGKSSNARKEASGRDDSRCSCCLKPFLIGSGVACADCGQRSCRKGCSRWDTHDNAWRCLFCLQRRSWIRKNQKWLETSVGHENEDSVESTDRPAGAGNAEEGADSGPEVAAGGRKEGNQMENVRGLVEKIVAALVGNVDDSPIDRLYDHPDYDRLFAKYHAPLVEALERLGASVQLSLTDKPSNDAPSMAHAALRELVERAVREAKRLPSLEGTNSPGRQDDPVTEHNYEDLLASAILNKVIEKFQNERVDRNSNVLRHEHTTKTKYVLNENEFGLDEGVEDGSSSLEPLSQDEGSDYSVPHTRRVRSHVEPLSLTIEERIEEVTTTYTSDDDRKDPDSNVLDLGKSRRVPFPELGMDIIDPSQESSDESEDETDLKSSCRHVNMISPIESWEENWLFQKKKAQTHTDSVSMLVPNSSAEFKALIGDKDAEDTSDLSDCSSAQSDEEIERELIEAIINVVPRSPRNSECSVENGKLMESEGDFQREALTSLDKSVPEKRNREKLPEAFNRVMKKRNCNLVNSLNTIVSHNASNPSDKIVDSNEIEDSSKLEENVITGNDVMEDIDSHDNIELKNENISFEEILNTNEESANSVLEIDEVILELPKTPRSTPMRLSLTEPSFEIDNADDSTKENEIFDSLESAKKKLMYVDRDEQEYTLRENEEEMQQERDYTEHYDIATQRHMDSLKKIGSSKCREAATSRAAASDENAQLTMPPRPGTIAEREHRKWENAAPIENNPYSEENIQRRLWERQYVRRPSDISNIHTEIPPTDNDDVEVMLGPKQSDIKRFSRDYYINNSKAACGDSKRQSALSSPSRPSSASSQRSGIDYERQDSHQSENVNCVKTNDVKSKVAMWQNNNAEINLNGSVQCIDAPIRVSENGSSKNTEVDEFLENERKNSKNEINAKLNSFDNQTDLESKKSYSENQKKIKRIDLKAYGFEKEFGGSGKNSIKPTRVVNKLDLKSFGYDEGMRRSQSNNHLDSTVNDVKRLVHKSNLTRYSSQRADYGEFDQSGSSGDCDLTTSTDTLDQFSSPGSFSPITSAKSMPNIADAGNYNSDHKKYNSIERNSSFNDGKRDSGLDENSLKGRLNNDKCSRECIPMPSVRKLKENFDKSLSPESSSTLKVPSVNDSSNGSALTTDKLISQIPRQMHSLTARSLSKQFREGLRQIPNKIHSPPVGQTITEQTLEEQLLARQMKMNDAADDTNVIAPGKLKSNIKFWEQLQKSS